MFKNKDEKVFLNNEKIILRDYLALERTKLANERTLFAYIRTSLYLLLAGLTLIQLKTFASVLWIGILSIFLSMILIWIGIVRYKKLNKQLNTYYSSSHEFEDLQDV